MTWYMNIWIRIYRHDLLVCLCWTDSGISQKCLKIIIVIIVCSVRAELWPSWRERWWRCRAGSSLLRCSLNTNPGYSGLTAPEERHTEQLTLYMSEDSRALCGGNNYTSNSNRLTNEVKKHNMLFLNKKMYVITGKLLWLKSYKTLRDLLLYVIIPYLAQSHFFSI